MRVLVVSNAAPWENRANGKVLRHHLGVLAEEHEITVFAAGGPSKRHVVRGPEAGHPGVEVRWFGTRLPAGLDYAVRRVRSELTGEPAHMWWVERGALARELRVAASTRPAFDVLHLHGWGTAQLYRHAPGMPAVHVAIDAWAPGDSNRLLPRWRGLSDAGQHAKIVRHERRHYPNVRAVVVVAPRDAAHLRAAVEGARIEVIPLGVDLGPETTPQTGDPVIGFHGDFSTAANRDAARMLSREILPRIRTDLPQARLLLIGRDAGPEVQGLAGDGVEVTGEVPDIRAALARVSVYVAPLVSGNGLKTKVLEAMAAGLPVVATPLALDGIGAGEGVTEAATSAELAEAVVGLLADTGRRLDAGRGSRARARTEFTWERSARAIESLWRDAAGRPA